MDAIFKEVCEKLCLCIDISCDRPTSWISKISCTNCSWCYTGKTGRAFNTRKKEHLRNSKTAAKGSRIANHVWSNYHAIDFENASIINKGTFRTVRKTLDAWHTKMTPNADSNSCRHVGNTTFFLTDIHNYLHFISQFTLFIQMFSSLSHHSFYPSMTAVRAVESS